MFDVSESGSSLMNNWLDVLGEEFARVSILCFKKMPYIYLYWASNICKMLLQLLFFLRHFTHINGGLGVETGALSRTHWKGNSLFAFWIFYSINWETSSVIVHLFKVRCKWTFVLLFCMYLDAPITDNNAFPPFTFLGFRIWCIIISWRCAGKFK